MRTFEDTGSCRVETGAIRFGEDWPGVFLRGDYALPMAQYLTIALDALTMSKPDCDRTYGEQVSMRRLEELRKVLVSCYSMDKTS